MAEKDLCKRLRTNLNNHQNSLQPARTQIHREKSEKNRLEKQVSRLESQIRFDRGAAIAIGGAVRLHPLAGGVAAVAGKTGSDWLATALSPLMSRVRMVTGLGAMTSTTSR